SEYFVFRGQSHYTWHLLPSLYVAEKKKKWTKEDLEVNEFNIYFDFVTNGKGYINNSMKSWEVLMEMRHFGLPVRVLDWTESFNAALYFAVIDSKVSQKFDKRKEDAAIFVLDPYVLNEFSLEESRIFNPLEKNFIDFFEVFLDGQVSQKFNKKLDNPFSIIIPRMSERIYAQQGLFTVQGFNNKCIDEIPGLEHCFRKIKIEKKYFQEIKEYLEFSGVNHFSIYPDFEGLAKDIKEGYGLGND
ncbi:MAG TPA: FRG domain-containing protein, partial [Bacteroidia bacterium]|nr:FRG domain-containing protein [Bacteroidia bacterium]